MKKSIAAAVAAFSLIAAGVFYSQRESPNELEKEVSKMLAESLIAATPSCENSACSFSNIVSMHFSAELFEVTNIENLFGYLHKIDQQNQFLGRIASAWVHSLRGSRLWWAIYDAEPVDKPDFSLRLSGFKSPHRFDSFLLVLSEPSARALSELQDGFDLSLNFGEQNWLELKTIEGKRFVYDFDENIAYGAEELPVDALFSELLKLSKL